MRIWIDRAITFISKSNVNNNNKNFNVQQDDDVIMHMNREENGFYGNVKIFLLSSVI